MLFGKKCGWIWSATRNRADLRIAVGAAHKGTQNCHLGDLLWTGCRHGRDGVTARHGKLPFVRSENELEYLQSRCCECGRPLGAHKVVPRGRLLIRAVAPDIIGADQIAVLDLYA